MKLRSGLEENKIYVIVTIFVILVITLTIIFSGSSLNPARIPGEVLSENWFWDTDNSSKKDGFLGLESFYSSTYRCKNKSFPAYITISTMKNFFMMDEDDLVEKTEDMLVRKTSDQNIVLDKKNRISGERKLKNGHKTMYFVYNATDSSDGLSEDLKIIGETWNCEESGTSVVCIGIAQISNSTLDIENNFTFWSKIVSDKQGTFGTDDFQKSDGLIFNVVCH